MSFACLLKAEDVPGPRESLIRCRFSFLRNLVVLHPREALGSPGGRW